jgi:hypothetical protein
MTCSRGSTASVMTTLGITGAISGLTAYFANKANTFIYSSVQATSEQSIQSVTLLLNQVLTSNINLPPLDVSVNGIQVQVQLPTMQLQEFISTNITASISAALNQGFKQIEDIASLTATTEISLHGGTLALLAAGIGGVLTTLLMKNQRLQKQISQLKKELHELDEENYLRINLDH